MPVIIKYLVERDGIEKMTFASKSEADAYDKLLDTAEDISQLLTVSQLVNDETQLEALSMYLAQNKDALLQALGSKRKAKGPAKPTDATQASLLTSQEAAQDLTQSPMQAKQDLEDLVIEKDQDQVSEMELEIDMDQDDDLDSLIDAA